MLSVNVLTIMKLKYPRLIIWLVPITALVLIMGYLAYSNRWHIGRRAVEIADPAVRAWASKEVARLSHGSFQLSVSTIRVDEIRRRIAIDTISLTTDTIQNKKSKTPLPHTVLRFRNCALEGIDLDQLTAGRGLHITHAGCDSVAVLVDVPLALAHGARNSSTDKSSFLSLTQQLDLPRNLPMVEMDTINFPEVRLILSIEGDGGRRTNVTFDRLSMQLDSLLYKRGGKPAPDRVMLSRDVRVALENFEGSREASSRLSLKLLAANLSRGTVRLDSLYYAPVPGKFADSLGVKELRVGHLAMSGVDWRGFLTSGDVQVGTITLDSAMIRLPYRAPAPQSQQIDQAPASPLEMTLRAIDRSIHLDTLHARGLTIAQEGRTKSDGSTISIAALQIRDAGFDNIDSTWNGPFPIGRMFLSADSILRTGKGDRIFAGHFAVDVPAGRVTAENFRAGPPGNDADFLRVNKYRKDRVSFVVKNIDLVGVDVPQFLHHGELIARRGTLNGAVVDVFTDRTRPVKPGPPTVHRYPQQVFRDWSLPMRADTILIDGEATYRERDSAAVEPSILKFSKLKATVLNFHLDQNPAAKDTLPLHLIADARFMEVGEFHLDLILPLQASTFTMRYRGSLGEMPATGLNSFLVNTTGVKFNKGTIEGIRFDAVVEKGHAQGQVMPRWRDLSVSLPGVARSGGFLSGVRRAVAGFAANTFVIRSDNFENGKTWDAVIDHQWQPSETLPKFLWVSLREALLPLLKK